MPPIWVASEEWTYRQMETVLVYRQITLPETELQAFKDRFLEVIRHYADWTYVPNIWTGAQFYVQVYDLLHPKHHDAFLDVRAEIDGFLTKVDFYRKLVAQHLQHSNQDPLDIWTTAAFVFYVIGRDHAIQQPKYDADALFARLRQEHPELEAA